MATTRTVRGVEVKLRRPWGIFGLTLLTFGVYYIFWYYRTNRELNAFGGALRNPNPLQVSPGVALLAITVGSFLIVPPFVSSFRTFKRIRRAQELTGLPEPMSPGLAFVLFLIGLIFLPVEMVYSQRHLNRLWMHVSSEEEKERLGMRGVPQASEIWSTAKV
jgi:Domain of unknown function (DUF4234)